MNREGRCDPIPIVIEDADQAEQSKAAARQRACDDFVGQEVERHKSRLEYDDRRRDAFIQNARQRFFLDWAKQETGNPATLQRICQSEGLATEQFCRLLQLDLKTPVDASKLTDAASILEYIDKCRSELQAAERRLKENDPSEYAELKRRQKTRFAARTGSP